MYACRGEVLLRRQVQRVGAHHAGFGQVHRRLRVPGALEHVAYLGGEHRLALRRVRLGLSDAVVANRFLLWGWVGVFAIVTVAPSVVVGLAGGDVAANVPARLANVLGGSACAVAMQLAFLPPARYRAWIERRAVA